MFLIHPLHVEPVAWLAARKDLLNGLFYFATIWCHASYTRPGPAGSISRGLRNLPVREHGEANGGFVAPGVAAARLLAARTVRITTDTGAACCRLGVEKLPLLAIAVAISLLAIVSQQGHGAIGDAAMYPLLVRLGNAAISYCVYLGQTFVPIGLAAYYPHPGTGLDWVAALLSALCCVAITVLCVLQAKRRPWLLVGWGWYMVVLAPVSGVVQIGEMARADRYTYIALVGIFLLLVQQGAEALKARMAPREISSKSKAAVGSAVVALILDLCGIFVETNRDMARQRLRFSHAAAVTDQNYLAHANLGSALFAMGRKEEGLAHYREALRLHAPAIKHHRAAALEAEARGDLSRATHHYGKIITLIPSDGEVRERLGHVLYRNSEYGKALVQFNEALRHNPDAVSPRRRDRAHSDQAVALR